MMFSPLIRAIEFYTKELVGLPKEKKQKLNRPKIENEKTERKTERNRIFPRQATWGGVAIKFSSKDKDFFFVANRKDT